MTTRQSSHACKDEIALQARNDFCYFLSLSMKINTQNLIEHQ